MRPTPSATSPMLLHGCSAPGPCWQPASLVPARMPTTSLGPSSWAVPSPPTSSGGLLWPCPPRVLRWSSVPGRSQPASQTRQHPSRQRVGRTVPSLPLPLQGDSPPAAHLGKVVCRSPCPPIFWSLANRPGTSWPWRHGICPAARPSPGQGSPSPGPGPPLGPPSFPTPQTRPVEWPHPQAPRPSPAAASPSGSSTSFPSGVPQLTSSSAGPPLSLPLRLGAWSCSGLHRLLPAALVSLRYLPTLCQGPGRHTRPSPEREPGLAPTPHKGCLPSLPVAWQGPAPPRAGEPVLAPPSQRCAAHPGSPRRRLGSPGLHHLAAHPPSETEFLCLRGSLNLNTHVEVNTNMTSHER